MKYIIVIAILLIAGCNIDKYDPKPIVRPTYAHATIYNNDLSIFGVTRDQQPINGTYAIYDYGTGLQKGSIWFNTVVVGMDGKDYGECNGTIVSDSGVNGDCILPNLHPISKLPCPDDRDGDFNPNYSPEVCHSHHYFWCSLAKQCLNKPLNVSRCGEVGSEKRRKINERAR